MATESSSKPANEVANLQVQKVIQVTFQCHRFVCGGPELGK